MASPEIVPRTAPRSTERLDRDRQAAPQVFDRLRSMIISLALPPGSALSRAALAGQFGVSSTPIRDALMRLDEEGLVEVFPQYATVVSRIDVRLAPGIDAAPQQHHRPAFATLPGPPAPSRRISCGRRWNWKSCVASPSSTTER